jgi:hypothetical protein
MLGVMIFIMLCVAMLNVIVLSVVLMNSLMLSVVILCHYSECDYDGLLCVVMLNGLTLSVVAPCKHACNNNKGAYFSTVVSYNRKFLITFTAGVNVSKLFWSVIYGFSY